MFFLCAYICWGLTSRLNGNYFIPTSPLQCVCLYQVYDPLVGLCPVLFLPVFQTRGHIYFSALQQSLCQGMLCVSADFKTINICFPPWIKQLCGTKSSVLGWKKYKPALVWKQQVSLSEGQPEKMVSRLCRPANESLFFCHRDPLDFQTKLQKLMCGWKS